MERSTPQEPSKLHEKKPDYIPTTPLELKARTAFEKDLDEFMDRLENQVEALRGMKPSQARDMLLASLPKQISEFSAASCRRSANFYMESRKAAGITSPYTPLSDLLAVNEKDVTRMIRYHAGGLFFGGHESFKNGLLASVDRLIRLADRDVWIENAFKDKSKPQYARFPTSNCCAFCLMIASRGFMTRHKKGDIKKAHNNCRCRIVVAFDDKTQDWLAKVGVYDPYYYREIYDKVGGDLNDLRGSLKKFREKYPEGITPSGYMFTHASKRILKRLPLKTPELDDKQNRLLALSMIVNGSLSGTSRAIHNIKEFEGWEAFKLALHGHKIRWIDEGRGKPSYDFIWESLDGLPYDFKERININMSNPINAAISIRDSLHKQLKKRNSIQERFVVHLSNVKEVSDEFKKRLLEAKDIEVAVDGKIKRVLSLWIMYADKLEKIF